MGRGTYTKRMKRRLSEAATDAFQALEKVGKEIGYATLLV